MTCRTHHPSIEKISRDDRWTERSATERTRETIAMECCTAFIRSNVILFNGKLAVGAMRMCVAVILSVCLDKVFTIERKTTVWKLADKTSRMNMSRR